MESIPDAANDVMDEALGLLAPFGPSYGGGLSNHGPMTAEALVYLGYEDEVLGWVERYVQRLEPRLPAGSTTRGAEWKSWLGQRARLGDWHGWFSAQLEDAPWPEVVGQWIPRLAPGIGAAGLHGVIRVGHAVCSLKARESPLRLDELSRALAYWAAEYLPLPGAYRGGGTLSPSAALRHVPQLPQELRKGPGLISDQMAELSAFPPFEGVIQLVDPSAGATDFLADLAGTFAGLLANTPVHAFDFLHGVTGAAAVAELISHVDADKQGEVLAYAWQAIAAIYARYAPEGLVAQVEGGEPDPDLEPLARHAVARGDEHAIKLVAACAREWERNPDGRLGAAAMRWVGPPRTS